METPALLVALVVQVHVGLISSSRQVHALAVDLDGRRRGHHVDGPDRSGGGRPAVAEDGLVIAVDDGHVRRLGQQGEPGS